MRNEEKMQQRNPRIARDMTILGGWLFADLLLALVVIFMAAQPPFPKPILKTPTPAITPTPTIPPHLDKGFIDVPISNVDYNGVLKNSSSATHYIENFLNNYKALQGRRAGLVIVYDGAPTDNDINDAFTIGKAVIHNVLQAMGRQGELFSLTSYYNPLYGLGQAHSTVTLDIYLFAQ